MQREKRLLTICKFLSIGLISFLILFYMAYVEPLDSLWMVIRKAWILMIIAAGLLYLVFTLVESYYRSMFQHISYLKILHEVHMDITPTLHMEDLSVRILQILLRLFRSKKGVLKVFDPDLKKFMKNAEFIVNEGETPRRHSRAYRFRISNPSLITEEARAHIENAIKNNNMQHFPTIAVVPFANRGNLAAIAVVATDIVQKDFFETVKEPTEIFSKQVSSVFESAMLHQEISLASITDPLTGAYNKRFFQHRLVEEFAKASRNHFQISVMISDLDNFKYYVDRFGHPQTDTLLQNFSTIVKNSLRGEDIVCRFGGDEFAYLLPYSGSLEAYAVAERVKGNVLTHPFRIENEEVFITLSFGIASFPEHGNTSEEVLKNADSALFTSKENGRNRITVYRER